MRKNLLIAPIFFILSSSHFFAQQTTVSDTISTSNIDEVVITALGLKGERDKFASSASTVKGPAVAQSGETGILTGLSAKASGVLITRNGGDPGAGAYIQIRGQNTINGNAQPLFIIDGMPVSNSSDKTGSSLSNGIVQQSRINDLNPNDIERVEVLKGASAAALWGTRAANGVIIITTKKGKNTSGKINISLKSTVSFDRVNKMHPLQTTYGQGSNGLYIQGDRLSFGDLIAARPGGSDFYITDPSNPLYQGYVTFADGTVRYAIAPGTADRKNGGKNSREVFDHSKDAFRTGHFIENNLTVDGGNEKSNFLLGFSNLNQEGVIKSFSDYDRQTARLNASQKFNDWFKASANVNYIKSSSSRVQEGDNVDGLLLSSLRTSPDFDNARYEGTYTDPTGQIFPNAHVSYRNPLGIDKKTTYANPFWNIVNNKNTSKVDRILGTMQIDITPLKWLSATARVGIDNFTDKRVERFAKNSANFADGYLSIGSIAEKQFNTDLFVIAKHTVSENIKSSYLFGFNYNSRRNESVLNTITNLIIADGPDILDNALNSNLKANNNYSLLRTYAFYSQIDVEAYNMLFLTLTGRSESASTFGTETSNSFFFPSAALAWQFSNLDFLKDRSIFSFGKLRMTWGQVGIQPQPYQNFTVFNPANFSDPFTNGVSSVSSLYSGGYVRNLREGNQFLRPEIKTEYEVGTDLRFFQNRFSFSATAYYNKTKDVILQLNVPASTGYALKNSNAAVLENKGLELDVNGDILRLGNFRWNISGNFSTNKNKVVSLSGVTAQVLSDSFIQNSSLIPGQPFGVFLSTDFLKDGAGNYILDANGFPQPGTSTEVIGDPNADWRAGLGSTFSYKDFSLYVLFDRVQGNDVFNGTRGSLYAFGTHGDQGNTVIVPAGGLRDVNGNLLAAGTSYQGQIYDFGAGPVALNQAWYRGRGTASTTASYKQFVEDGSATRLREITFNYTLKSDKLKKKLKLSSINFSVTGRNLILWTKYTGIDPESNVSGAGLSRGQDWFTNPNTKSLLASILINY
ncbi:SusC/RagA family TonB-linked outer membrane protein [Chryseobacterium foetidum]|uniref:SusC/RagA family TonB-linked outer membrane protein n=1 Tax=Chryseobacterium foetidum TaxID=2951057 RepID=UPI0021C8968D|nr:SusC/RagA family TonB-linked outer membrane protein [Chryseobacterium foetidum]